MAYEVSRTIPCNTITDEESTIRREWLATNGLGGFASGTLSGSVSRRYHGLLVAALPAPLGRTVMLSRVEEKLCIGDEHHLLNDQELIDTPLSKPCKYLKEFRMEMGLPVWVYQIGQYTLEKRILLQHQRNTVLINYTLLAAPSDLCLELRPAVHFRALESVVDEDTVNIEQYRLTTNGDIFCIEGGDYPPLSMRILCDEARFTIDNRRWDNIYFRLEYERGYPSVGKHWSPGCFSFNLAEGQSITLMATTEDTDSLPLSFSEVLALEINRRRELISQAAPQLRENDLSQHLSATELILAADQFIITPACRAQETATALQAGEEAKTIIAGYHWFTDWGRDTMISLEGLTLVTGRYREARHILRTFASYIRDGLIPNMFPEHGNTGLYHTADASLWFFHALDRYVSFTDDRETLRAILPKLISVIDHHIAGTRFNIGIDPSDGLLKQGEEGYQLTWMDAKVGDWVVTPRRGKAVELNALWYNALRVMEKWLQEEKDSASAARMAEHAARAKKSFNEKFWNDSKACLYDVIDGPAGLDESFRPNQIFSIALPHPVLDQERWASVVDQVSDQLLTPFGLRSLSPHHSDYKQNYDGDLYTRDAAYHQGTVWAWLIGPYIDAWVKTHPHNNDKVNELLSGFFYQHMNDGGIGSISEIFDAEPPYAPRGCIAQAWSVAEVLRCIATYQTS